MEKAGLFRPIFSRVLVRKGKLRVTDSYYHPLELEGGKISLIIWLTEFVPRRHVDCFLSENLLLSKNDRLHRAKK